MKKGHKRSTAALIMLLVAGLQLHATGAQDAQGSSSAEGGPVELSFLVGNQSNVDGIKAVAEAAEEDLNIKIVWELGPAGSEGDNLLKTRLAAEEMPDLNYYNSGSLFQALKPQNHFADLTDIENMSRVNKAFTDNVSVDGKIYAAPAEMYIGSGGWIYNKRVYKELGLEVPRTWDELMANCEVIKNAGKTPVLASYKDSWTAQMVVLSDYYNIQAANPNFAEDYTNNKVGYADTPEALRSFQRMRDLYDKGYIGDAPMAMTFEEAQENLAMGDGVHYPMLTFVLGNIAMLYPDKLADIGFFPQPSDDPSINGVTVWLPNCINVYKNNPNVEESKRWLEYYLSDKGIAAYMTGQKPDGPHVINGVQLPDNIFPAIKDILPYVERGDIASALEFSSPIKGPSLEQICVQAGLGIESPLTSAQAYDKDVEKQAKQLGLPGW